MKVVFVGLILFEATQFLKLYEQNRAEILIRMYLMLSFLAKALFWLIPALHSSNYHQIMKAQEIKGKIVSPQRISCFLIAPHRGAAADRSHQIAGAQLSSSALMKLKHCKVYLSSGISSVFSTEVSAFVQVTKDFADCSQHASGSAHTLSMTCQQREAMKEEERKSPQVLLQGHQQQIPNREPRHEKETQALQGQEPHAC